MKKFNSARAFLNQLESLKLSKARLLSFSKLIKHIDLTISQYAQLFVIAKEFKPDLIVEFGRGYGNSTSVLTEVANQINDCQVVSICLSNDWQEDTVKSIAKIVPKEWFDRLDTRITNILDVRFEKLVKNKNRILVLWDAHGWDVAEYVLSKVLPALKKKEHLILVHDISDFNPKSYNPDYGNNGIWRGYPGDHINNPPYVVLGSKISPFEELIAIYDFASRNSLSLFSVQEELNDFFTRNPKMKTKFERILGEDMSNSSSSFLYFSLNYLDKNERVFFPKFTKSKGLDRSVFKVSFNKSSNWYLDFASKKPLVSIVTPCYNSGKYIEECIQSVLSQDYPFVEHVIQDGGSKDGTLKVFKKYSSAKYKDRIKWVSGKDSGQSDGLNKAIQRASGEIILVLNGDDVILPYACSWGVFNLNMNPSVAVIYGDQYVIDERGNIIHRYTGPRYDYEKLLSVEIVPAAQAAFIRRSSFEQVGLGADSTLSTCPDYEMWVRIGARFEMKYVPGYICKYRQHEDSEGQRADMIVKMVKSKKEVMDRVFKDRKTPLKIKKLKKRAYAGVEIWGAINHMKLKGPIMETGKLVISSFLNYPPNIWKYRKLIPGGIISFGSFVLKTYSRSFFK